MHGLRIALPGVVVVGLMVLSPAIALASCAAPPTLPDGFDQASVVFIGEVVAIDDSGKRATVEVHQVWKGPDLPPTVEVLGGPGGTDVTTSVDRRFRLGRYVFFPTNGGTPFTDNECTLTQPVGFRLDEINPFPDADPSDRIGVLPAPAGEVLNPVAADQPGDATIPVVWVLGGAGAGLLGAFVWRRAVANRRPSSSP